MEADDKQPSRVASLLATRAKDDEYQALVAKLSKEYGGNRRAKRRAAVEARKILKHAPQPASARPTAARPDRRS